MNVCRRGICPLQIAELPRRLRHVWPFWCAILAVLTLLRARADSPSTTGAQPRTRVVIVHDPRATDEFSARPEVVHAMVDCGVTNLTGKATVSEAWRSLISTQGVSGLAKEIVGIKVDSAPGPNSGTRPAVVAGIVEGLLAAGVPAKHIVVWDRQITDLRLAGYSDFATRYGIRIAASAQEGYDDKAPGYDNPILGNLVSGDLEFGAKGDRIGRKSYYSKLVTREITKIISVTPLLNHNYASVSGHLYGLSMGSVDNIMRFDTDAGRLARAVPEIYAQPVLSDHVVLNVTDALICQYEGGESVLLHYSATLNELRFSKDPVALDALSVRDLARLRKGAGAPLVEPNLDLYSNAALLELGVSDLKHIQEDTVSTEGRR
jgi:hypothetical protein